MARPNTLYQQYGGKEKTRQYIAKQVANGLSALEIADQMDTYTNTVTYHLKAMGFVWRQGHDGRYGWFKVSDETIRDAFVQLQDVRQVAQALNIKPKTVRDALLRGIQNG